MFNTEGKWRDRLWKDGLSKLAEEAVEFFIPDLAADRDARRPITAVVASEVPRPESASDLGMRIPDVLMKIPVKKSVTAAGEVAFFVEQQHESDKMFTKRIYDTFAYLRGRYEQVTALAIFTGNAVGNGVYEEAFYGTSLRFDFNTYAVRDADLDGLRGDERAFAGVMLAARLAFDAKDVASRERGAWELLETVARRSYSDRTKALILKFSGGVFKLMDAEVDRNLREAYKMVWEEVPLEEFARRVEISNAREEGEEIGMAKGLTKGLTEGRAEGRTEGRAEGRTEGRAEGRTEGILTVVRNMLADNMPIRDIARLTGMKERDIIGLGV